MLRLRPTPLPLREAVMTRLRSPKRRRYRVTYRLYQPTDPRFYDGQPHITVAAANRAHAMRLVPDSIDAEVSDE
ncbi:MAG TPA: hypothetical protein VMT27_09805 [Actinomycetes bacterium]|nr:hypothetical protein [Actinomycetes bacterium]